MKLDQIKAIAIERGLVVRAGRMRKAELIHLLQEKEGNLPCFNTGMSDSCGQQECCWRADCD